MARLEDYRKIVGEEVIEEIYAKAKKLYGKRVLHINSTKYGGGVAEILNSLVPLMNDIGIKAEWKILNGNPDLFKVTKKFHNALQGDIINITNDMKELYLEASAAFAKNCPMDYDCVIVHDPQPLPLIQFCKRQQPWVWRCHVDVTEPHKELWEFLKIFISKYDTVIFSSEKYKKADLPVKQKIIHPSIDPLTPKNQDLPFKKVVEYIKKAGVPTDRPVMTQVSRMDPWKDPEGLLEVFERVREKIKCRLVYCYDMASDDPEGVKIYSKVYQKAKEFVRRGEVIFVVGNDQTFVNAIQRFSTVVVQKSIREGFCLAVTEALWKAKPVVATYAGGIPLQIIDGQNGFLVEPYDTEGFAERVMEALKHSSLTKKIGEKAKETVRKKFLITRLLADYLELLNEVLGFN